ncbi:hypothetical protein D3C77_413730 [compost metagenome]
MQRLRLALAQPDFTGLDNVQQQWLHLARYLRHGVVQALQRVVGRQRDIARQRGLAGLDKLPGLQQHALQLLGRRGRPFRGNQPLVQWLEVLGDRMHRRRRRRIGLYQAGILLQALALSLRQAQPVKGLDVRLQRGFPGGGAQQLEHRRIRLGQLRQAPGKVLHMLKARDLQVIEEPLPVIDVVTMVERQHLFPDRCRLQQAGKP